MKPSKLDQGIKIVLSLMLFVCLADMPYGYYQLVRFLALIGFSWLAYSTWQGGRTNIAIVYIGLALLFQPFVKVALGREIWNIVDVLVGAGLIVTLRK